MNNNWGRNFQYLKSDKFDILSFQAERENPDRTNWRGEHFKLFSKSISWLKLKTKSDKYYLLLLYLQQNQKNIFITALGEGEAYILDCPFSSLCRQVGFLCFKIYCSTNLLKVQDLMFANMEP